MEDFLLGFLGSLVGTYTALKLAGGRVTHKTYIHCPKGVPRNITFLINTHKEFLDLVRRIDKKLK